MLPLVLYDIPSELPGYTWSANPGKPRLVLGYKNLPFETVWIEYCDVAPKLKEIGAPPNKLGDGSEKYTLPVLRDPNTGAFVADSWAIAEYLDKTYPEKPVFPDGSKGLIAALDSAASTLLGPFLGFAFVRSAQILNERSRERFIETREAYLGTKFDEWSLEGPSREAYWENIGESYYGAAKSWYDKVEGEWLVGNTLCYGDIILAAHSLWLKKVFHDDEWQRIASLHDGKWEKLLANVERECNLANVN